MSMETPRDWDRDRGEGDGFGGTGMEKTGGYTIDRGDRQEVGILDERVGTRHCEDWKVSLVSWTWSILWTAQYHPSGSVLVGLP